MRKTRERDGQIKIERVPSFFLCVPLLPFSCFFGENGEEWVLDGERFLFRRACCFFFLKQSKGEKEKT